MESCSRHDIGRSGSIATMDAVCTLHGQQITMHVAITAASENAYHSEMHSTMSPGANGMTGMDMATDAKWLGPCAPG